jgi:hypothetical protein
MGRTIFIRHRPEENNYRVVVKPHPGTIGTNAPQVDTHDEALAHANLLQEQFGWPIVDES